MTPPVSPAAIVPRCQISIRVATMDDLPFMDGLQKQYGKALGYFPTKQFEGYISMGAVLLAEDAAHTGGTPVPLGYCISRDRYLKRDELGVIYQLCVAPGLQRKLVGAALVKEVFARSAYGCKLYCCWCAQDLDANYFWESMGFLPIAFRAGSDKKRRVHIFWQRRIVEGDVTTPYWFPSQTNQGAIREDRLVFPIPPGVDWREVEAVVLPGASSKPQLQAPSSRQIQNAKSKVQNEAPGALLGFSFAPAKPVVPPLKPRRAKRQKVKNDPKHVAAARELRDRYLERFNSNLVLGDGKYHVARVLAAPVQSLPEFGAQARQLPQAA